MESERPPYTFAQHCCVGPRISPLWSSPLRKQLLNSPGKPTTRATPALLPPPQGALTDSQFGSEPPSRPSFVLPPSNQLCSETRRFWTRVIADEPEDLRKQTKLRFGLSRLPPPNNRFAHPELVGDLPLKQPEAQSPLPNVISQGDKSGWIRRILRFWGRQGGRTKRQRGDVRRTRSIAWPAAESRATMEAHRPAPML